MNMKILYTLFDHKIRLL